MGCSRRRSFHKGREISAGCYEAKTSRTVPQSIGYNGTGVPLVLEAQLTLDLQYPLELDHLRKTIHNLCLFYTQHFTLVFPRLNAPLLLYKQIRNLSLPSMAQSQDITKPGANETTVVLHPQTLQISQLLSSTFEFPLPGSRQQTCSLPEIQLVCLLVIAVKLYHPFDSSIRRVRSLADPAALTIDWESWVDRQSSCKMHATGGTHLERGSEISVTEKDVMNMTGEQLDEYMDWYERTFVDESRAEEKPRALPKQLLDMFPIGRIDGSDPTPYNYDRVAVEEEEAVDKKLNMVICKLRLRNVLSEESEGSMGINEDSTRIGSFYKRYRKVEDLTPHAKAFHEAVAQAVGIGLETLILAVGQVERRLVKWKDVKVKADKMGGDRVMEKSIG